MRLAVANTRPSSPSRPASRPALGRSKVCPPGPRWPVALLRRCAAWPRSLDRLCTWRRCVAAHRRYGPPTRRPRRHVRPRSSRSTIWWDSTVKHLPSGTGHRGDPGHCRIGPSLDQDGAAARRRVWRSPRRALALGRPRPARPRRPRPARAADQSAHPQARGCPSSWQPRCPVRHRRVQGAPCGRVASQAIGCADSGLGARSPGAGSYQEDGTRAGPAATGGRDLGPCRPAGAVWARMRDWHLSRLTS